MHIVIILSICCVREVFSACGASQLSCGDGLLLMTVSNPEAASVQWPFPPSTPETFNLKVMKLVAILDTLPDGVDKGILIFKAFGTGEGFMKTSRQAMTSSTSAVIFALREFINDNKSWKLGFSNGHFPVEGPWLEPLHLL